MQQLSNVTVKWPYRVSECKETDKLKNNSAMVLTQSLIEMNSQKKDVLKFARQSAQALLSLMGKGSFFCGCEAV